MKKLLLMALSVLSTQGAFAGEGDMLKIKKKGSSGNIEQWIVIGARGGLDAVWMFNKNVIDDDAIKQKFAFGGHGGVMLGFHFSEVFAIAGECLYAVYNRKLSSGIDSMPWNSKTTLKYLEIPVLIHLEFEGFKHLELGIKFGMLKDARESRDYPDAPSLNYTNEKRMDNYAKSNKALVLGWGSGIWGNGGLLLNGGFRITYGLDDIISEIGGKGQNYVSAADPLKTKSYQKTNIMTFGFHLSADFDLGWVVKSSCGRNYKFSLFKH